MRGRRRRGWTRGGVSRLVPGGAFEEDLLPAAAGDAPAVGEGVGDDEGSLVGFRLVGVVDEDEGERVEVGEGEEEGGEVPLGGAGEEGVEGVEIEEVDGLGEVPEEGVAVEVEGGDVGGVGGGGGGGCRGGVGVEVDGAEVAIVG